MTVFTLHQPLVKTQTIAQIKALDRTRSPLLLKSTHPLLVRVQKDNQDPLDPLDPQVLQLQLLKPSLLPRTITRGTEKIQNRWSFLMTQLRLLHQRLQR